MTHKIGKRKKTGKSVGLNTDVGGRTRATRVQKRFRKGKK